MPGAECQVLRSQRKHAVADFFEQFFVHAPAGFDVAEVCFMKLEGCFELAALRSDPGQ